MQGKIPMLLSGLSVVLLVGVAISNFTTWIGMYQVLASAAIAFYLLWLGVEAKGVAAREIKMDHTGKDRGTLELYAAARAFTVIVALLAAPANVDVTIAAIGLVTFISGVFFRIHAIRVLGRFYSHRVRIAEEHAIVSRGPYRIVRHPAYSGMLMAHVGFVLVFPSYWAAAVLVMAFFPAVAWRIRIEERMLYGLPGYRQYASGRRRLFPGVW